MTIFDNNKCKNKYEQDGKALNVHLQPPHTKRVVLTTEQLRGVSSSDPVQVTSCMMQNNREFEMSFDSISIYFVQNDNI